MLRMYDEHLAWIAGEIPHGKAMPKHYDYRNPFGYPLNELQQPPRINVPIFHKQADNLTYVFASHSREYSFFLFLCHKPLF